MQAARTTAPRERRLAGVRMRRLAVGELEQLSSRTDPFPEYQMRISVETTATHGRVVPSPSRAGDADGARPNEFHTIEVVWL